jgi:hypothetical protein
MTGNNIPSGESYNSQSQNNFRKLKHNYMSQNIEMSNNKNIYSRMSANNKSSESKDNNQRYRIKTTYGTRHSNMRLMQR